MQISSFDDLLSAARAQTQPQRLLFVFTAVELPEDATPAQRAGFERGEGGSLVPQMCVDKAPDELASFDDLKEQAALFGKPWGMVFAAAMVGAPGQLLSSADADQPLEHMVESIKKGQIGAFIPFDLRGQAVQLA
jgi:hypothetical protein